MAGERTRRSPAPSPEPKGPGNDDDDTLPYGYERVDRSVVSRNHPPPPRQYYGRQGTPHPGALRRDPPMPPRSTVNQSAAAGVNATVRGNEGIHSHSQKADCLTWLTISSSATAATAAAGRPRDASIARANAQRRREEPPRTH